MLSYISAKIELLHLYSVFHLIPRKEMPWRTWSPWASNPFSASFALDLVVETIVTVTLDVTKINVFQYSFMLTSSYMHILENSRMGTGAVSFGVQSPRWSSLASLNADSLRHTLHLLALTSPKLATRFVFHSMQKRSRWRRIPDTGKRESVPRFYISEEWYTLRVERACECRWEQAR